MATNLFCKALRIYEFASKQKFRNSFKIIFEQQLLLQLLSISHSPTGTHFFSFSEIKRFLMIFDITSRLRTNVETIPVLLIQYHSIPGYAVKSNYSD